MLLVKTTVEPVAVVVERLVVRVHFTETGDEFLLDWDVQATRMRRGGAFGNFVSGFDLNSEVVQLLIR